MSFSTSLAEAVAGRTAFGRLVSCACSLGAHLATISAVCERDQQPEHHQPDRHPCALADPNGSLGRWDEDRGPQGLRMGFTSGAVLSGLSFGLLLTGDLHFLGLLARPEHQLRSFK